VKYGTAASPYFNNSGCISSTSAALPFFQLLDGSESDDLVLGNFLHADV